MGRLALGVAATVLAGSSLALVIAACGSDDEPGTATADGGTSSGSTPPGTPGSTPPGTPSGNGDGGSTTPPAAATTNPRQISCGGATCDAGGGGGGFLNSFQCCIRGTEQSCQRLNECDEEGDIAFRCDEPADCPGGGGANDSCCLRLAGFDQQLRAECNTLQGDCAIELCKSNADCIEGTPCNPKKCRGIDVMVCGSPNGCQ